MKIIFKLSLVLGVLFVLNSCETDYYASSSYYLSEGDFNFESSENYKGEDENPFVLASEEPVSTFSVDADGGSYSNTRRFINDNQIPPKESVRIEEYINYFTFDYPDPTNGENVALNAELSTCPWNDDHHLMRVGMKGLSMEESEIPNANYVFLIDVSGSMSSSDKLDILKDGFIMMAENMRAQDRVAIVTYAGKAAVLLESTSGDEQNKIIRAIKKLGAGGSTAGAEGIMTAYEIAEENFITGGNNRVILGSDGDFNVGPSSTDELIELIEEKRESGIYLTVLGVGTGNLNDHMMEQIANKGNGNYEYIDNEEQLKKVFVYEPERFYSVAKDSKIQITFNPDRVKEYRLIGYENRSLEAEDFENDTTDAGEIGAGQTITAMYELVLNDSVDTGKFAQFDFRYKKPEQDASRLIQLEISSAPKTFEHASENMRFAAAVTGFGLINRESDYAGSLDLDMVKNIAKDARNFDKDGWRAEFLDLLDKMD